MKKTHDMSLRHAVSKVPRDGYKIYVADPAEGLITYTKEEFLKFLRYLKVIR